MATDVITLKDDYTFLVSDHTGDVLSGLEGYGMYLRDTRYLSRLELLVDGEKPQTLSYTTDYNIAATFRLSDSYRTQIEPDSLVLEPTWMMVAHAVGITRRRYIRRGLVESLEFINYHSSPVRILVSLRLGADFVDIFEVRGIRRGVHGHDVKAEITDEGRTVNFQSVLPAEGHADLMRHLSFECDRKPDNFEELMVTNALNELVIPEILLSYALELKPHEPVTLHLKAMPEPEQVVGGLAHKRGNVRPEGTFAGEVAKARRIFTKWQEECTTIETDSYALSKTIETSVLDLRSLMQQEPEGLVVTAGLPWYFTLFGRDSLITAMQCLCLNPQIAIDTLRTLAAYQATEFDDWRDSEPGKILHELRRGDMTLNNEMPHSPYYGSVDSTLLFIQCFADTLKWVNDKSLFEELWPNIERALQWAEQYGDLDGDGYIEFRLRSKRGILHQGWKDSDESMGGSVGPRPEPPVALVEVQGYYYAALLGLAETLRRYAPEDADKMARAEQLEVRAVRLKEQFNRDFWWEEEGFFAQALDGRKRQVRNVTSNIGHCLWSGIVDEEKARSAVQRLMQPDMRSGWGIRTISMDDPTYNPMSYHNGSIWPHDNSLAVAGLRRYGYLEETMVLAQEIFDAAATFEDYRLPELYCGFRRGEADERESAPAAYPVSCSPQAWAAGTPILLLQSLLGLQADAFAGNISISPVIPTGAHDLTLSGVRVGDSRLLLCVQRDRVTGNINFSYDQQTPEGQEPVTVNLRQALPASQQADAK